MERLLLIDGHNLLFQMFYGMPNKIPSKDGRDIRGVVGFIGGVLKLIKLTSATHTAVIFDSQTHNPRCELLEEYKANRPDFSLVPDEENPFSILSDVYSALDVMKILHTEAFECECDDVIASYAHIYGKEREIYISSYDSDFFQLINDNVKVIRYRGDCSVVCDEDYVMRKFATHPALYADAKALFGDSADNIRGIQGVGPKTAAKIVNSLGHVEDILSSTDKIENPKIRKGIEENTEIIKRNISLIRLDSHVPLPFSLEQMKLSPNLPKTMDVISKIDL